MLLYQLSRNATHDLALLLCKRASAAATEITPATVVYHRDRNAGEWGGEIVQLYSFSYIGSRILSIFKNSCKRDMMHMRRSTRSCSGQRIEIVIGVGDPAFMHRIVAFSLQLSSELFYFLFTVYCFSTPLNCVEGILQSAVHIFVEVSPASLDDCITIV